jgi:hypothetical protein
MPQLDSAAAGGDCAGGMARTTQSDATGFAAEQCRAWLEWAATQVDLSLASDATACSQLLASLDDLMGPAQLGKQGGGPPADEAVDRKMSAVIVAVQGHDRVMQGLAHVAQSLRALGRHLGDARCAESSEAWRRLREQQMQAFSMAEERVLFARMLAHDSCENAAANPDDAMELFGTDHGSVDP